MPVMPRTLGCSPVLTLLAAALGLAACATSEAPSVDASAGLSCVDDSRDCIERRQATLKAMLADKSRAWIRDKPTPHAYASGVRLFAFRGSRTSLSCDELGIGRREAEGAGPTLRGPGAKSLTPAQVSRGAMLGTEVSKELAAEARRRCKA